VIAFNDIEGGVGVGTFDLMWGNKVHGGLLAGDRQKHVIANNTVTDANTGIYSRGVGQIEGNVVTDCTTGILAVDSQLSVTGAITGNAVANSGVAIRVDASRLGARDALIINNHLAEFSDAGIWFSGPVDRLVIAGNLVDSRGRTIPSSAVGIRLDHLQGGFSDVRENTVVGGSTGVLVSQFDDTEYPIHVTVASNIVAFSSGPGFQQDVVGRPLVTMNNDVYGNTQNWSGLIDPTGLDDNISQDPMFVDPDSHDWRLTVGSPCVDTGVSSNLPWDLDGCPRVTDGNGDGIPVQDMGAFELPANANPECAAAVAGARILWPPNHQMIPITITGVSDPDGDAVTIEATGVTQDEPVSDHGSGDTSPDALIVEGQAQVRAERLGEGDGRVYRLSFRATDGRGGQCESAVTVCVPHDPGHSCVDEGQSYDSLEGAKPASREGTPGAVIHR
jgi:hypothetical protein